MWKCLVREVVSARVRDDGARPIDAARKAGVAVVHRDRVGVGARRTAADPASPCGGPRRGHRLNGGTRYHIAVTRSVGSKTWPVFRQRASLSRSAASASCRGVGSQMPASRHRPTICSRSSDARSISSSCVLRHLSAHRACAGRRRGPLDGQDVKGIFTFGAHSSTSPRKRSSWALVPSFLSARAPRTPAVLGEIRSSYAIILYDLPRRRRSITSRSRCESFLLLSASAPPLPSRSVRAAPRTTCN